MNSMLPTPRRRNSDDNLIPLINIVFLLLIFFMIAGQVRNALPDLELPRSESGVDFEQRELRVAIDRNNQLLVNGEVIAQEQLAARVADASVTVTVLAHRDLRAEQLDQTLDILRQAGVVKFSLLAEFPETAP